MKPENQIILNFLKTAYDIEIHGLSLAIRKLLRQENITVGQLSKIIKIPETDLYSWIKDDKMFSLKNVEAQIKKDTEKEFEQISEEERLKQNPNFKTEQFRKMVETNVKLRTSWFMLSSIDNVNTTPGKEFIIKIKDEIRRLGKEDKNGK